MKRNLHADTALTVNSQENPVNTTIDSGSQINEISKEVTNLQIQSPDNKTDNDRSESFDESNPLTCNKEKTLSYELELLLKRSWFKKNLKHKGMTLQPINDDYDFTPMEDNRLVRSGERPTYVISYGPFIRPEIPKETFSPYEYRMFLYPIYNSSVGHRLFAYGNPPYREIQLEPLETDISEE